MRTRLPLAVLLATSVLVPAACSSKKPPPPAAPTTHVADAGADAAIPAEAGAVAFPIGDGGLTPASAWPTASGSAPPLASSGGPLMVPVEAADGAIDLALRASAQTSAPNMQPEGQPGRATLAEGQTFGMLVTMQPNRCYTIMGYSPAGGVSQLNLNLLAPPLYNIPAGQSGANEKNQPVIGKGKAALCPLLPLPIAYKVEASAKKGSGRIGIVVFSRPK